MLQRSTLSYQYECYNDPCYKVRRVSQMVTLYFEVHRLRDTTIGKTLIKHSRKEAEEAPNLILFK